MASSTETERNLLYNIKNQFTTSCLLNLHDYVATHPGRYTEFLSMFDYNAICDLMRQVESLNYTIVPGIIRWLKEARNLSKLKDVRPNTQQLKTSKKVKPITKFKRFSSRERKLKYLDDNIDRIKSMKHCVMYAKLLDNYIDDGNTDWELFNSQFTKTEIDLMIANLKKCPTSASHIIKWLEKAKKNKGKTTSVGTLDRIKTSLKEKKSGKDKSAKEEKKETTIDWLEEALSPLWFTSFEKFSKDKKLEYLRLNLRHITSPKHCKVYAKMLNNYMTDVTKTEYDVFRKTFIEKDIKFMITHLKKCSDSKPIVGWLEKMFRLTPRDSKDEDKGELAQFAKKDDYQKLVDLKINLSSLSTDNCELYGSKLEIYINKNNVQKDYVLFAQAFTVDDVNRMLYFMNMDHCRATTSDIEWLNKALTMVKRQPKRKKNTSKEYVDFANLSKDEKLRHLKQKYNDIKDKTKCTLYVDLLENYIDSVKTDYEPYKSFIETFTAKEVENMHKHLNPIDCEGSAIFTIIVWLDTAWHILKQMVNLNRGPSRPTTGASRPATSGPTGASRPATSGPTGASRPATSGPTGASRPATSGPTGASRPATSGPTGASRPATSGPTGASRPATSGPTGASRPATSGPPGASRPATSGPTGASRPATSGPTGASRPATSGPTGPSRPATSGPTGPSRPTAGPSRPAAGGHTGASRSSGDTNNEFTNFTNLSDDDKLKHLKDNLDDIKNNKKCQLYIKKLNVYIARKTDYTQFMNTFKNDSDIQTMITNLRRCPGTSNTMKWLNRAVGYKKRDHTLAEQEKQNTETWLQKHLDNQKYFLPRMSNNEKLQYLKRELSGLTTNQVHCKHYAHMLDDYIKGVKKDDEEFMNTFKKSDIDNMIHYIHKYNCPENTYEDVLGWLKNVLKKFERSGESDSNVPVSPATPAPPPLVKPPVPQRTKPPVPPSIKPPVPQRTKPPVPPGIKPPVPQRTKPLAPPGTKPPVPQRTKPLVRPDTKPPAPPGTKPLAPQRTKPLVRPDTKPPAPPGTKPPAPTDKQQSREVFKKLSPDKQLDYLKKFLKYIYKDNKNDCYNYARLLCIYIENVQPNYAPFIKEFTKTDIQDLLLKLDDCTAHSYDLHNTIADWLLLAQTQQEITN